MRKALGIAAGIVSVGALLVAVLKMRLHRKSESDNTPSEPPAPRTGFWAYSERKKAGEAKEESLKEKAASKLNEIRETVTGNEETDSGLEGESSRLSR